MLYTTKQAAQFLGISERRIRELINPSVEKHKPLLAAHRVGRDWLIEEKDLKAFQKQERKSYRPVKNKPQQKEAPE